MKSVKVSKIDTVILGAGIAGLGAALKAREKKIEYVIFEAEKSAGGLLDNFNVDGYRFDNAVHLSFATEKFVRDIFDKVPYHTYKPNALNFDNGKWLKHPVQNNLFPLSSKDKIDIITSYIQRVKIAEPKNYEEWLRTQFGEEFAIRYPERYTRKYWQNNPSDLSTNWIGKRLNEIDLSALLYGAFNEETENNYYATEMRYPIKGGYKAFIQNMIDESLILYGYKVVKINPSEKKIYFSNKMVVEYKQLISSIPLPMLVNIIDYPLGKDIISASNKLEATSIDLISVGFNVDIIKDLWFYIYDEDILASRAYSPSVKSRDNVPEGCSSLQFEIYNPNQESKYSISELKENTLYALKKLKLAKDRDIAFLHHKHIKWGNVIFKIGMEENRDKVIKTLNNLNIKVIGRFGEWEYFWSNQSLLSGYNYDK